jgi:serine O-acetyltransferase
MGRTRQALMGANLSSDGTPSPVSQAWSASQRQELLVRLAREHFDHPLPAGLRQLAEEFVYAVLGLLFPHFASRGVAGRDELAAELAGLDGLFEQALTVPAGSGARAAAQGAVSEHLYSRLGSIREALLLDAQAMYEGDPAAGSVDEVILAYPGFLAIATYRIAHELHGRVALFPRLLCEVAHRATGIDIHPRAQIGASFAIDHGTGIVIGETAVLGARVMLYQGVTLGAARVNKRMEHVKRHPTIGDDVVIYANATILGGETIIGTGSRIGGNVWLTRSVPPYSVVTPTAHIDHRGQAAAADDLIEFNI